MEGAGEDRGGKEGGEKMDEGPGEVAGGKRESVGDKGEEGKGAGAEEPEKKKFKVRLGQRDDLSRA